ncbi:hypothetical protein JW899_01555 [Candidatus Uhrbacteria bacterium]|nr:hypothetical protein [Candidatus Uhrbacteria bacterium]
MESHAGHSDFQGDFFVYDIGKQEYLQSLASTDGISGSGGVPVWLRLVVSDGIADGESCGERKETGRIRIAGHLEAVRCEGTTMGDLNSVWFVISASGKSYIYSSDVYEGDDRRLIDKIVKSTVLMTK